jgi:hypothetical protein
VASWDVLDSKQGFCVYVVNKFHNSIIPISNIFHFLILLHNNSLGKDWLIQPNNQTVKHVSTNCIYIDLCMYVFLQLLRYTTTLCLQLLFYLMEVAFETFNMAFNWGCLYLHECDWIEGYPPFHNSVFSWYDKIYVALKWLLILEIPHQIVKKINREVIKSCNIKKFDVA